MAFQIDKLRDIARHGFDDVIDVRSPAEFAEDHMPGAINLPALSNEERAIVGTIYVQQSPFEARRIGAAMVARNVAQALETQIADREGAWSPLVYCWRGGQRSGSVATILKAVGWRTEVVKGGYKAFRRAVVDCLYATDLLNDVILLDGNTGTAKTAILGLVQQMGGQTIDLEGLANHRGSILGPRPEGQPSQKLFESRLAMKLVALDPTRPVLIEAESSKIGDLILPPSLWKAMCGAPRIETTARPEARARYLSEAYRDLTDDREHLVKKLDGLVTMQGRETISRWQEMARGGSFVDLAGELISTHYDPRYGKSRGRHEVKYLAKIDGGDLGTEAHLTAAKEICRVMSEQSARIPQSADR